jgi:imidazolonepropionase-like amidohydrolase
MNKLHRIAGLLLICISATAGAQTRTEREQGLRDNTPRWHALTGATLVIAPGRVVPDGIVLLRDGVIVAAGAQVNVPAGARVWPLQGRRVYAGFIDMASSIGVPQALQAGPAQRPMWGPLSELPAPGGPRPQAQAPTQRSLAARSTAVRAEQDVAAQLEWKPDEVRAARELGFTAVLATPTAGNWRGQGALLALGAAEAANAKSQVILPRVTQHLSFEIQPRGGRGEEYPASLMGAVALARQTLLDARWYRTATQGHVQRLEPNSTLAALAPVLEGRQPLVAVADDEQDYGRIARLRDEFGLRAVVVGNGVEYRRAAQIKAAQLSVVLPLNYPGVPEVSDADGALDVPLATLQHWEQAPSNAMLLHRAGVPLAFTTLGLRDAKRDFWPRVRQAVQRGLPADAALAALTTAPAAMLGQSQQLGTLEAGRIANLVVTRGDPFVDEAASVELVFVDGRPLPVEGSERGDPRGQWRVQGSDELLRIAGPRSAPRLEGEGAAARCELTPQGRDWVLRQPCHAADGKLIIATLKGEDRLEGSVQVGQGPVQPWAAQRSAAPVAAAASAAAVPALPAATYPAGTYGIPQPAQPAVLLVRNATVWTQGPAGKLEGADVLVREGRITAVGKALAAPAGAQVVDASGKHVTPGLIDAHSHIAVSRGINEGTHSVTAEVRVADALDPTDISIYRQLAGGLTAANLLHGSANTIGGQNQIIKLRWGGDAQDLVFAGAKPGIKFALGENVKRSNWGEGTRYPVTRMGVEQVLRDSFAAAREYAAHWRDWRANPRGRAEPRRDLQLETLVELLERKRVIHIHSYRADEILMFVNLARELNLEVAAFQHVLEGYKVADAIASINAGASSFSDWWAFKIEVIDAVPHNGAMLQRAGVLTTFNSDDAELARRMNTEAAKAQRYGGLDEQQALALVTINAARQLRVEQRTGSLEVGKDADFVIWSDHPLSNYARAEQTWIDGRRYFDLETDRRLRDAAAAERTRLVAAALRAPRPAAPGGPRAADREAPPTADFGEFAWRRTLDLARSFRHAYATQDAWHECTEDHGLQGLGLDLNEVLQ